MDSPCKYSLSFTATSFRLHDFLRVANALDGHEGTVDLNQINAEEILGKGNQKTSNREMAEFLKRYNALTATQRNLLLDGTIDEQKHVTFLAITKSNSFIRDFMLEVVRDKFSVFDFQLTDGDYRSFVNRKIELHPELENFADSTLEKARQTLFKILADAGIINNIKDRTILQQWLSPLFIKSVTDDNNQYLKVFLLSEKDINLAVHDEH